jgi:hypothetical protein
MIKIPNTISNLTNHSAKKMLQLLSVEISQSVRILNTSYSLVFIRNLTSIKSKLDQVR